MSLYVFKSIFSLKQEHLFWFNLMIYAATVYSIVETCFCRSSQKVNYVWGKVKTFSETMDLANWQGQQMPNLIAADTTVHHSDRPLDAWTSATDVQDTLLSYLNASTIWRGDPMSQSLAVSLASLEKTSETATVFGPLTTLQDSNFDKHFFIVQDLSEDCCENISNR